MSAATCVNYVLITGPPGIGKTTIMKKVCEVLKERKIDFQGFFTEEVRRAGQRIGFDIIATSGVHSILARINDQSMTGPKVGKYVVNVKEFERIALPSLECKDSAILLVDEIGKMELFSQKFQQEIQRVFKLNSLRILATVPIASIPIVEEIKRGEKVRLIHVNKDNRDTVPSEIIQLLT